MTTEEKIFELLKYANNEAVAWAKVEADFKKQGKATHQAVAEARKDSFDELIKYWESLNKK